MFHLSKEEKYAANLAGLRKKDALTRRCPMCGAELLWQADFHGVYVAMDYDEPAKDGLRRPHILTCTKLPEGLKK